VGLSLITLVKVKAKEDIYHLNLFTNVLFQRADDATFSPFSLPPLHQFSILRVLNSTATQIGEKS
jgi:hypothetical protein